MENNKAYLQKIHWVFLLALPAALLFGYSDLWLRKLVSIESDYYYLAHNMVPTTFFYAALGVCTRKWKETAIAFGAYALLDILDAVVFGMNEFRLLPRLLIFLASPLPLMIFLLLQFGWQKRMITIYFLNIVVSNILFSGFYGMRGISDDLRGMVNISETTETILGVLTSVAGFVCAVIMVCELMNYAAGKTIGNKTRLLNLGNSYDKMQGSLTFWALKTMIWTLLISCAGQIDNHISYFSQNDFFQGAMKNYFHIMSLIAVVSYVFIALALSWYLRKFMLEYFITYNTHSKFLYWFSLLPVVGLLTFVVANYENTRQAKHNEKLASLGQFAASSTTSVTAIFFILLVLRLMFRVVSGGEAAFIISLIISALLFVWMISDRTGFYVNLVLNLALLAAGIIVIYGVGLGRSEGRGLAFLFGAVLLNVMHLLLLFPVYHFADFEYTPAEDPDESPNREFHLFDTH